MTKYFCLIFALLALFSCQETPAVRGTASAPPEYKKSDLKKLDWIVGNWKTDLAATGYYQTYYFSNDSTLEVVSYAFNGKDTSSTTLSTLYWKNNHLYLGPNGEWVAVLLDNKSIQMDPVRMGWHTINWTKNGPDEWTSVQQKPEITRTIKMKRQPALSELLKR